MGNLLYGTPPTAHEVDDRTLAHLQIVIVNKFRRGECFSYSLPANPNAGSGRQTLWMHPSIPVQFSFHGSRVPAMNPTWVQELMNSANSGRGLQIVPEPQQQTSSSTVAA